MEHFVGIDVAKDRLDVHLRPSGESFAVARDGEALAVECLRALAPALVVMEATGSMPQPWPISPKPYARGRARLPMPRRRPWVSWWRAVARLSR